ncbi:terminase small subunit-like protein [Paraburkholderia caffeinilytica]|uniref:terminase small subunit-like protein n=1 Tax=Paraburkholderia caffeinilytica TaxID=1761016 RepID=UPI0038B97C2E
MEQMTRLESTSVTEQTTVPGRHTPDAVIDSILASVARGEPLMAACESAGVGRTSFYRWLDADPELVGRYAHAVQQQTQSRFSRS